MRASTVPGSIRGSRRSGGRSVLRGPRRRRRSARARRRAARGTPLPEHLRLLGDRVVLGARTRGDADLVHVVARSRRRSSSASIGSPPTSASTLPGSRVEDMRACTIASALMTAARPRRARRAARTRRRRGSGRRSSPDGVAAGLEDIGRAGSLEDQSSARADRGERDHRAKEEGVRVAAGELDVGRAQPAVGGPHRRLEVLVALGVDGEPAPPGSGVAGHRDRHAAEGRLEPDDRRVGEHRSLMSTSERTTAPRRPRRGGRCRHGAQPAHDLLLDGLARAPVRLRWVHAHDEHEVVHTWSRPSAPSARSSRTSTRSRRRGRSSRSPTRGS